MDLLADRLAQRLGLGRREPGKRLRDLHVLLLVDADPVRVAGDRLQTLVDERHRLLAVLARRVHRDVRHRAGAVERDEGDQVLELGRPHLAERLAHAGRLELEDAHRLAAGEHLVRLAVVERDRRDVEAVPDQADGCLDHVEVSQPEEVHLEQAERLDVPHGELGHELGVGALLLQGDRLDQRRRSDHDARGMDRVGTGEPLERTGQVDDLLRGGVGVDGLPQLRAGLEGLRERLAGPFRNELRNAVDGAVRDLQHATRIANGSAGRHRREGDDLGHTIAAVLLGDVVDHALAALDGEVDVDVGHRLAARVEEALEEEVVADRVDVGDLEAVRDERAGGQPRPGPTADPVALREADEVGDDQEVVGEAHLPDRLQLELEPLVQLRGGLP